MSTLLTLPALVVLISFPGLGWLKKSPSTAPADSLPPPWRSASRLALENDFVLAKLPPLEPRPVGLKLQGDPRRLRVSVDPDSGTIAVVPELGEVALGAAARQPLSSFATETGQRTFQRQWSDRNRQSINSLGQFTPSTGSGSASGLSFRFPSPLPKKVQSFLGPGGPALTLSGSENIRLSGTSNWSNQQIGFIGRKASLFPSLDMQQDLDLRLEGQLSDRIKVNLLQNSGVQIPLANRLYINYRGEEDDLIQALDLGNTQLTLPGTQYVSYSGKNEGLFGVKATSRLGPLDFTLLATKQEGRSERATFSGGGQTQEQTLNDFDYLRGVYFFLYDPNESFTQFIPDSSIRVYLDDYRYDNDANSVRGRALVDPTTPDTVSVRGTFSLLNPGPGQDYEVLSTFYGANYKVLRLARPLSGNQRLGVTYTAFDVDPSGVPLAGTGRTVGGERVPDDDGVPALRMKLIRGPVETLRPNTGGTFDTTDALTRVRELELKNVYQLPGQGIDPKTFQLEVRRGQSDPPITFMRTAATGDTSIPYIEVLGLDSFDETGGVQVPGHDGRVDGSAPKGDNDQRIQRLFVDYDAGTLLFLDLRPFAPRLWKPFEQLVDGVLLRRARLDGPADSANAANAAIYDKYSPQRFLDSRYFIWVRFNSQRASGEISLGRGNLLEGSETVAINGIALVRDRDYTIDYDLGRVNLKRQLAPTDNLSINYAYAPLFQQASRTLVGSAFRIEGREKSFGGAFMYESKGAQDLRPRIGEEPSQSIIGDLNTDWTLRPAWVTRMVNALPLVRTVVPSEMRVQAEVGASLPNPNTKGEVSLDDMEGVRDAVSLSLDPRRWLNSGVPSRRFGAFTTPVSDIPGTRNAEARWYLPLSSVEERELKPNLEDAQGARNKRQVMAISVPRRPAAAAPGDSLWVGLTYVLDPVGLDLSRSQFLEIWTSDFNDYHTGVQQPRVRGSNVRLNVELGVVSEDQQRAPDAPPNGRLDTEDLLPRDGQLTVTDAINEDTGYDGLMNPDSSRARDLTTASSADPEGDDFQPPLSDYNDSKFDIDPRRYRFINGSEKNRTVNPSPDTEDLNQNVNLDTREDYLSFTIDLGDPAQRYLVTDVQRDYNPGGAGKYDNGESIDLSNGWRRYRIPLGDSLRTLFGLPDLTRARHVRLWLDGIDSTDAGPIPNGDKAGVQRPFLMIGGIDIVGSRWQSAALTPAQEASGTTVTLNSVNTVDNADIYAPPFDPGSTRTGSQELTRREQSMVLEFTSLQPEDTLETFKAFSINEDYSRYRQVAWYVAAYDWPDAAAADTTVQYFVRFASDEQGQDYYEYKARVPLSGDKKRSDWREVRIPIETLSGLKLRPDFPKSGTILYRAPGPFGGDSILIRGRPSFTRLRRISFGVVSEAGAPLQQRGQLWLDEVRATEVERDAGFAERMTLTGNFANLLRFNANYDGRDANFVTVGQSRGTGFNQSSLTMGGTLELHRFFEATGIVIPVNYNYSQSLLRPRFTAGDDVRRTGALEEASKTQNITRNFSTSYSRVWTDRSNPFLRHTIGGFTGNYARTATSGVTPTLVTNGLSASTNVNWSTGLRNLLRIPVPLAKRTRFTPLPERIYTNYASLRTATNTWSRSEDGSTLLLQSAPRGRSAFLNMGMDSRPFDFLSHRIEAVRNLALGDTLQTRLGPLNIGRQVSWRQSMDVRFGLNRGMFFSPNLSWNSYFSQDNRPEISRDLSVKAIGNGQAFQASWNLPFDRLAQPRTARPAPLVTAEDSARARQRMDRGASPFELRSMASRLGGITADFNYDRSSSYSRLTGRPSVGYLFGVSTDPGLGSDSTARMSVAPGNTASQQTNMRGSARTRLAVGLDAFVGLQGEYASRRWEQNGVTTRTVTVRFPAIEVDYGRVASVVRLNKVLTSPRLRTSYSRSVVTDFRNSETTPVGRAISSAWQPLISLEGDFRNQTRMNLKIERRITARENFQLGHSVTNDRNTDINVGFTRSYSRGQKVKFLFRESTVRTSVSLGLNAVYSRQSGETVVLDTPGRPPQNAVDRDRLSVNANGRYSFSNNVNGNITLGFGQNRDLQRQLINRNVRVELSATFTF